MDRTVRLLPKRVELLLYLLYVLLYPLSASADSVTYQYDAQHRLIGASYDGGSLEYSYDIAGNMLNKTAVPSNAAVEKLIDSDSDGITDVQELTIYGTDPLVADTDGDGINDGDELEYWGSNWNGNANGNSLINLLDMDSDSDGFSDGEEITMGGDPASSTVPATIVYEDAENGNILGWGIYDGEPVGSFVGNVYDLETNNRVIEFTSAGLLNGFKLLREDNTEWNNTQHQVVEWRMKFTEDFIISVAVLTDLGIRFISFTPDESSSMGLGTDISHGLGAESKDGTWRTYYIDLGYDLDEAQPGNTIQALRGFYVNGSGRIDDIKTHLAIPDDWDSDRDGMSDNDEIYIYGSNPYHSD